MKYLFVKCALLLRIVFIFVEMEGTGLVLEMAETHHLPCGLVHGRIIGKKYLLIKCCFAACEFMTELSKLKGGKFGH